MHCDKLPLVDCVAEFPAPSTFFIESMSYILERLVSSLLTSGVEDNILSVRGGSLLRGFPGCGHLSFNLSG